MLLLKALLSYAIPDVPRWVETEMAKVEHRRRQFDRLSALGSVPSQDSVGTHDREAQTDNISVDRETASTTESTDDADMRCRSSSNTLARA
jgi:anoctamin-8